MSFPHHLFIHKYQYNYDHQNSDHNTDVSDIVWVRNKVYSYVVDLLLL